MKTPPLAAAAWARHLASPPGPMGLAPTLTLAEAERVQRHRDQLLAALRAHDRAALVSAKQQVLDAAFSPRDARSPATAADSPALRRALRDLSWRMAAFLLPRNPRH